MKAPGEKLFGWYSANFLAGIGFFLFLCFFFGLFKFYPDSITTDGIIALVLALICIGVMMFFSNRSKA